MIVALLTVMLMDKLSLIMLHKIKKVVNMKSNAFRKRIRLKVLVTSWKEIKLL